MQTKRLLRLLRYVAPYWPQLFASVLLMALFGLMDAFRILLIGPILDRVLSPTLHGTHIKLFTFPGSDQAVTLDRFVPPQFQNDWTVVAFALVSATFLKRIFDYTGTSLGTYSR